MNESPQMVRVIDAQGNLLSPCSPDKAKKLIAEGKAKQISQTPLTIQLEYEVNLPVPKSSSRYWNGALAAPTLANIDSDANLEVVVNTVYAGFVAYEIPNTPNARILWGTGREGQVYKSETSYLLWTK